MRVVRHKSVDEFLDRAGPWLRREEAENNLVLGIASHLKERPEEYPAEPHLLTVEGDGIAAAALMTPPQELVVTRASADAMEALADSLLESDAPVTGLAGPVPDAEVFAQLWSKKSGRACSTKMTQRVYQCDRVLPPKTSPGHLRRAEEADVRLLAAWRREYRYEAGLAASEEDHDTVIRHRIADGQLFVWEDNEQVSMACFGPGAAGSARVFLVYTPQQFRRRGYATSCVAALTQHLIEAGNTRCYLYADLANSTSNGIYRQIGYRPVCDSRVWQFG